MILMKDNRDTVVFRMQIGELKEFIKDMNDETILSISVVEEDDDEE